MIKELQQYYGTIFENDLINEIAQVGSYKEVKEGFKLIDINDYIKIMPLLLSGVIKVLREDDDGDELLLYYLEKGDTCSVTMTCCIGNQKSEIRAIAETDSKLIAVPIQKMEEWSSKYKSWRRFVFDSYHNRINELLHTIDSIAFHKMDERLTAYLLEKSRVNNSTIIKQTHQQIAYDLHSSRVVISRLLKQLEKSEKIKLHRNYLEVINLE